MDKDHSTDHPHRLMRDDRKRILEVPPAVAAPGPIALDFGALPETLLQQLVRHWLNERHAPDILPVQVQVLTALLDHIRRQTDTVQALRGDPDSSEAEHMRIMLVQTEVERVNALLSTSITCYHDDGKAG
ncbi:hypothetical protein V8E52_005210 [Russula decolorans]